MKKNIILTLVVCFIVFPSVIAASYVEVHNKTFDGGDSPTEMNGVAIKPLVTRNLTQVGVNTSVTATACRVYNVSASAFLYNGSITSANCYPGTVLNAGSTYYVVVYSSGATYVQKYKNAGAVFPIGGTSINWTNGIACQSSLVCSGPVVDTYLRDVINLTMTDVGVPLPNTNLTYNVSTQNITNISATIKINGSESFNVTVCYGVNSSVLSSCTQNIGYANYHYIDLNLLSANTTYYFNVTGMDTSNLTNRTGIYNFTTIANPPAPIQTYVTLNVDNSTVFLVVFVALLFLSMITITTLPYVMLVSGFYNVFYGFYFWSTSPILALVIMIGFGLGFILIGVARINGNNN